MNKRLLTIFAICILILPTFVSALEIKKTDKGAVVIAELDNPAVYEFEITNNNQPEDAEIFSLVGVSFSPRGTFELPTGITTMEIKAYPNKQIRRLVGPYIFDYQIKGQKSGIYKDTLELTIVNLADTIVLEPASFRPGDSEVKMALRNTQNTYIDNIKISLRSEFFERTEIISFKPHEIKNLTFSIDSVKTRRLQAGRYVVSGEINLEKATARIDSVVNYLEMQGTSVNTQAKGFLVKQTTVTKRNEGNVPVNDMLILKRDVLTRLFTSYSSEPLTAERSGLVVTYTWQQNLEPAESWSVTSTTNYTLPFILFLLIIVVALTVRQYSKSHVKVTKHVSYVKTRGGEFALKVRVSVKARDHVENIQIIDRLPGMTKLYEKFGTRPDKIDASTRRLFWNIERMQAGEERVFSYIIYSNLRVVGKYELPAASAVYERDGQMHETLSNRAFFISDSGRVTGD